MRKTTLVYRDKKTVRESIFLAVIFIVTAAPIALLVWAVAVVLFSL